MSNFLIRSAYGDRFRVVKDDFPLTMAKQSFRDECDINNVMVRFEKTGLIEHVNKHGGQYADVSQVFDYQDAMNQVLAAQEAFASLPAKVRRRFNNDPAEFLAAFEDEDMRDELQRLGLLKTPPATSAGKAPSGASDAPEASPDEAEASE